MRVPSDSRIFRYGMVPVFLALAVLISESIHVVVPHCEAYILIAAVAASAWIGRRGPGLLAAILAVFVLDYFFLPPLYTLGISPEARPFLIPFGLSALAAVWMGATHNDVREARANLQRSEEKFRRILTNLPDVAWTANQDGDVVYMSPKIKEVTGYSKAETIDGGLRFLFGRTHPDDLARVQRAVEDLFSRGIPFDVESRFQRKDGAWIWIYNRAMGTYKMDGIVLADGVVSDISRRKQAEIDLQSKTAFMEALLNSTNDGILVLDAHGHPILQNQRMVEIHQWLPEFLNDTTDVRMLKHTLGLLKAPDSFLAQIDQLNSHPDETGRDEVEFKDGTFIDRYSAPVVDASGKYYGRIWTHREITQRKRTEVELQAKTAFLEAQSNSTIDGILVVDMNGLRIFQNQRMVDIFRIPSELLESGEDRPVLEYVLKSVKNSEAFLAKVEYLYSHPDKTSLDQIDLVDGTILDRYSAPVVDKSGKYFGRIWNFRDVTERKRDEDKLRQLSVAVEQSSSSIVITDPSGKITYVNRKFTEDTGYTLDEAVGRNPRILNSGHSPHETYEELWATILKGKEWRGELCNKKKNGELFWESAAITPIVNGNGAITHFLAVKEDITGRRQLESELRQAQKLEGIGQLAAGIAHEINTPIQFVTDNLTFLSESFETVFNLLGLYRTTIQDHLSQLPSTKSAELADAEQKGDLEYVSEEVPKAISQSLDGARRVASIVRAMKEFSHPDSADKTTTDLNKGIVSTITVARNEWKYVAEVVTDLDAALPHILCYPGEVNQIILNLIVNSAHSIKDKIKDGEKGTITISTRSRGPFAEITIADTGMGIPEAIRNRIFEPFFTTKEVGKGTGQGLAFAHSVVVKKHRGKIWFETEPGRGTKFFIQLPTGLPATPPVSPKEN